MSFTEVLAELAVNLRLDSSAFASGSSRAVGSAKKLETGLGGVSGALSGIAGSFAGGILIGGIATLGDKLFELGKGALEHAASLHAESQQLGVTTDDLQAYRFAASQVGIDSDKMDMVLRRLSKSIGNVANGFGGPAKKAFEKLGIDVRDSNGHLKTAGELLPELAGAFAKVDDPATKAALAVALFARSGQDALPLLNQGAAGVNNLTKQARDLGLVLTPQQIERAHQFEVNLSKLKQTLELRGEAGLVNTFTGIADAIDKADARLAQIQSDADKWDKSHNVPTKSQFLGQFATDPLGQFDRMLKELQADADSFDKRLGIPPHDKFFTDMTQQILGTDKASVEWRSHLFAFLETIPGKLLGAWHAFSAAWDNVTASTHKMVLDVESWLKGRLTGALHAVEAPVTAVGDWFHNLYERVVGHSYVPDMVDGVGAQMARLDAVMVAPAEAATAKAGDAFQRLTAKLEPLLRELFPEEAAKNDLADRIDTINQALDKGALDSSGWIASLDRLLKTTTVSLTADVIPALGDMNSGIDDIGASVDQSPMLPWLDKVTGALQGVGQLVGQLFGQKAGGLFGAILNAVGAIAPLFGGGGGINVGGLESSNATGLGLPSDFFHRALGGPVVPGRTYMVGESGPEFLTMGGRGYVTPARGENTRAKPYFDLRGAVMTADLLRQMNAIGEVATGRGAIMGAAAAEQRGARRASQQIP